MLSVGAGRLQHVLDACGISKAVLDVAVQDLTGKILLILFDILGLISYLMDFVKLRDHPLMSYRGVPNWPPLWTLAKEISVGNLRGALGVLRYVHSSGEVSKKCYLVIEHERDIYVGYLLCQDHASSTKIAHILRDHIGRSIQEIGDLDLSYIM